jgi:hypothetical protein
LQVQLPATQVRPGPHARPHAPQLCALVETSTQVLGAQQISGAVHDVVPQAQLSPVEQPLPAQQRPFGPQSRPSVSPSQVQAPATQVSPGLQLRSQLPQWKGSLVVSMQPSPGQQVLPLSQAEPLPHWQTPPRQLSDGPQARSHAPQWALSSRSRTQTPPQQVSSERQIRPPQRWSVMATVTRLGRPRSR